MTWDESKHPRTPKGSGDPSGEFKSKLTVAAKNEKPKVDMLNRLVEPDGGFTYNPVTDDEPKVGFAVSIFPERSEATTLKDLTFQRLVEYANKNRDLLGQKVNYLGTWHDPATGRIFLDVSRVVKTSTEAHALCNKHDQVGYYNLAEGKSVTVNKDAKSGGAVK